MHPVVVYRFVMLKDLIGPLSPISCVGVPKGS